MAIASLWDQWTDKSTGEIVVSFTMLTVNAGTHPPLPRAYSFDVVLPDTKCSPPGP